MQPNKIPSIAISFTHHAPNGAVQRVLVPHLVHDHVLVASCVMSCACCLALSVRPDLYATIRVRQLQFHSLTNHAPNGAVQRVLLPHLLHVLVASCVMSYTRVRIL